MPPEGGIERIVSKGFCVTLRSLFGPDYPVGHEYIEAVVNEQKGRYQNKKR